MSNELRRALIQGLMEPEDYKDQVDRVEVNDVPLYDTGCIGDTKFHRILLNCGSALNLLPYRVLKSIGINTKYLSPTLLTIQGFNQVGQRAMASIALKVMMDDLYKDALFHVIDVDTSYKALLGRPWLHTSKSIVSTLHQCLKYTDKNGMNRPYEEIKIPFMKVLTMPM
ncbi:hypothetical protein V2J09_000910 [Rumex salicifolius]